jgi:hypothetical protein
MLASTDDLTFAALPKPLGGTWRRPSLQALSERIGMVPVADTEVLQLSHFLPLVIEDHPDGMQVMALLQRPLLSRPVIGPGGRWLPAYAPVALRTLPFRRRRTEKGQLTTEILKEDGLFPEESGQVIAAAEGGFADEVKAVLRLADRLLEGRRRLEDAARTLAAADLLSEIHIAAESQSVGAMNAIYSIDPDALDALSGSPLHAMADDALMGIELASAMAFSSRLLASELRRDRAPSRLVASRSPMPHRSPSELGGLVALDVRLDGSELISFEHFMETPQAG